MIPSTPKGRTAPARSVARRLLFALTVLLAAVTLGCGRKLPPQPVIPAPPAKVRAWQREGEAMVSWLLPSAKEAARLGSLEGYRLRIERLPARCPGCPALESRVEDLEVDDGTWEVERRRGYYRFPLPAEPSMWRFRLATVFGQGMTTLSRFALLEAPAKVPPHILAWEWAEETKGQPRGPRRVRLYWKTRRERIVRVLTRESGAVEKERFYRANLYRRNPRRRWPLTPLNGTPLVVRQAVYASPPPEGPGQEAWQFTLRLVDEFGNEGPPAPPVTVPVSQRR